MHAELWSVIGACFVVLQPPEIEGRFSPSSSTITPEHCEHIEHAEHYEHIEHR
ncbi:hypothetical protein [Roseateles sp. BYS96W]|uniref:Uncharacterized protein n=1 Tax=Pelomonas nitida TaxID=3299027 RepID=A0ABW7GDB9_9BURK